MAEKAALVTGGSSGIGLAIAKVLVEAGYAVTIASRRPEKLATAAAELRALGGTVVEAPADLSTEQGVVDVVARHRAELGRLDLLVNNAGMGVAGDVGDLQTKHIDLQLALNIKAVILFYREALPLLRAAGAEHGNALVVNVSSITGKRGHRHISVYSATKHAVVGFTQSMDAELAGDGIKSCALCPAYVDTELADYKKGELPAEEMITVDDVAGAVRFLIGLSKTCAVPEIMFTKPGELA
ncbi:MAG TPA: SDR family oxidoreductase [Solirubrobacterales bacterium]|nr:SDR family oxidoreductase [Solirubrobacterales bacterium]